MATEMDVLSSDSQPDRMDTLSSTSHLDEMDIHSETTADEMDVSLEPIAKRQQSMSTLTTASEMSLICEYCYRPTIRRMRPMRGCRHWACPNCNAIPSVVCLHPACMLPRTDCTDVQTADTGCTYAIHADCGLPGCPTSPVCPHSMWTHIKPALDPVLSASAIPAELAGITDWAHTPRPQVLAALADEVPVLNLPANVESLPTLIDTPDIGLWLDRDLVLVLWADRNCQLRATGRSTGKEHMEDRVLSLARGMRRFRLYSNYTVCQLNIVPSPRATVITEEQTLCQRMGCVMRDNNIALLQCAPYEYITAPAFNNLLCRPVEVPGLTVTVATLGGGTYRFNVVPTADGRCYQCWLCGRVHATPQSLYANCVPRNVIAIRANNRITEAPVLLLQAALHARVQTPADFARTTDHHPETMSAAQIWYNETAHHLRAWRVEAEVSDTAALCYQCMERLPAAVTVIVWRTNRTCYVLAHLFPQAAAHVTSELPEHITYPIGSASHLKRTGPISMMPSDKAARLVAACHVVMGFACDNMSPTAYAQTTQDESGTITRRVRNAASTILPQSHVELYG